MKVVVFISLARFFFFFVAPLETPPGAFLFYMPVVGLLEAFGGGWGLWMYWMRELTTIWLQKLKTPGWGRARSVPSISIIV